MYFEDNWARTIDGVENTMKKMKACLGTCFIMRNNDFKYTSNIVNSIVTLSVFAVKHLTILYKLNQSCFETAINAYTKFKWI